MNIVVSKNISALHTSRDYIQPTRIRTCYWRLSCLSTILARRQRFILISIILQTHHVYSTLKQRGNGRFHVVPTWNTRGVFAGYILSVQSKLDSNIHVQRKDTIEYTMYFKLFGVLNISQFHLDKGRKVTIQKIFRRLDGRLLKVLCTCNLRPVSRVFNNQYYLPILKRKNCFFKLLRKCTLLESLSLPFKRQSHKLVNNTQTIRRPIADELFEWVWPFCEIGA